MDERLERDLKYNWHPYTQMAVLADTPPLLIERAEGIRLWDAEGRWYYDTISSWWCNVHGHGHPRIREAIARQMEKVDHVLFAAITHEPAIRLSERLVSLAPRGLERVFYSDDGSTAVEVALKMSLQYWRNVARPGKKTFICLERGYHGDTIGCMSVSGVERFNGAFGPVMFDVLRAPAPYCYRCPAGMTAGHCGAECAAFVEDALRQRGEEAAAVILEPLLLAAGGMIVYPPGYLSRVARAARECRVHLILDEVATGFGRTGTMFACEQAGVSPDFLCLSKGLTSGTLPLAATLTTAEVYRAFLGPPAGDRTFYHGHTFTANPIGCAAALASLDLFDENQTLMRAREAARLLHDGVRRFGSHPNVADVRCIGMVAALELVEDKAGRRPLDYSSPVIGGVYRAGLRHGLILRPLGNVVYLYPPLCATTGEIEDILARFGAVMNELPFA